VSREFYLRYMATCNAHDFDALDRFVDADVHVNDEWQGLTAYVAGLREVVREFPDYHWDLRDLFVDGDRVAARFADTGTHAATGRKVQTREFAFYRLAGGLIREVWVAADHDEIRRQLGPAPAP